MKKLVCIILTIVMILSLISCNSANKNKIFLNDYLKYSVDGFESCGYVYASFDKEKFYLNNISSIKFKNNDAEQAYKAIYGDVDNPIDVIYEYLCSYEIPNNYNFKNGDIVRIKWTPYTEHLEKYFDMTQFLYEDIEINIESLGKMTYFDPFEDIDSCVQYIGSNGNGYINPKKSFTCKTKDGDLILSDIFICRITSPTLKNGDVVKIEIIDSMLAEMKACGYCPTRTEYLYTCNGFDEMKMQKFEDIDQAYFDAIDNIFKPEITKANTINNSTWKLSIKVKDIKKEGYYHFYKEDNDSLSFVVPVYKIKQSVKGQQVNGAISWPDDYEEYYMSVRCVSPFVIGERVVDTNYSDYVKKYIDYPTEYAYFTCYWEIGLQYTSYTEEYNYSLYGFDTINDLFRYYKDKLPDYKYKYYAIK